MLNLQKVWISIDVIRSLPSVAYLEELASCHSESSFGRLPSNGPNHVI